MVLALVHASKQFSSRYALSAAVYLAAGRQNERK